MAQIISSIRFERKHSYFKTLAQKIKNFKNITLSLSKRHQRLAAIVPVDEKFFSFEETDYINEINIDSKIRNLLLQSESWFTITDNVNYYGIKISINDFFIIKFQNCNHFCKINFITKLVNRLHIIVEKYKILSFENDLFSYSIESCNEFALINLKDIQYHKKMITFIKNHEIFITKICEI
jgi:hypothetical protein